MNLTKITVVLAVIAGIILYFLQINSSFTLEYLQF